MRRSRFCLPVALAYGFLLTGSAAAANQDGKPAPQQAPLPPPPAYKTITVQDVVCKPEVRQVTVAACRLVPETKVVNCVKTVVVPQRKTWTENYMACRMTFETVERDVTVMVPHREVRQGVRTVCKPIPTQVMKTVCRDLGQWTTKTYVDHCGCEQTCQVWAANIVTEQVPVTVLKPQFVQEPFQYDHIVCRPEVRHVTQRIPRPIYEAESRQVSCVVPVCKQVEQQVSVTTYRTVVEPKVVSYTAMVAVPVTRQVLVPCSDAP